MAEDEDGFERAASVVLRAADQNPDDCRWQSYLIFAHTDSKTVRCTVFSPWENPWTCRRTRMGVDVSPFSFSHHGRFFSFAKIYRYHNRYGSDMSTTVRLRGAPLMPPFRIHPHPLPIIKATRTGGLYDWQRMRDSNPRKRSQSPVCYRYTNPLCVTIVYAVLEKVNNHFPGPRLFQKKPQIRLPFPIACVMLIETTMRGSAAGGMERHLR